MKGWTPEKLRGIMTPQGESKIDKKGVADKQDRLLHFAAGQPWLSADKHLNICSVDTC